MFTSEQGNRFNYFIFHKSDAYKSDSVYKNCSTKTIQPMNIFEGKEKTNKRTKKKGKKRMNE